jgi:hypothetical protein
VAQISATYVGAAGVRAAVVHGQVSDTSNFLPSGYNLNLAMRCFERALRSPVQTTRNSIPRPEPTRKSGVELSYAVGTLTINMPLGWTCIEQSGGITVVVSSCNTTAGPTILRSTATCSRL